MNTLIDVAHLLLACFSLAGVLLAFTTVYDRIQHRRIQAENNSHACEL